MSLSKPRASLKRFLSSKVFLLFLIITSLSFLVRFLNFESLLNFHLDPPFHLHEVKDMVEAGKPRLVGPMVYSKMVEGRGFFTGPTHYYLLSILGVISNWNVVLITAFYTLLWIIAFILLFFFLRKKFGDKIALIVYALFSFYWGYIPASRMIWNPHLLPVFGVLLLWFLDLREKRKIYPFLAGLSFSMGLSAHYAALFWIPIVIYFLVVDIRKKKLSFSSWALSLVGAIIPLLPLILFELRHDFYNIRTVFFQARYFKPTPGYTLALSYYYVLPLVPLAGYLAGFSLSKFKKRSSEKSLSLLLVLLSGLFLINSLGDKGQSPTYPKGWNLKRQERVIELIVKDNEPEFEVAETVNSDTRAYDIRWWLRERGIKVMDVTAYDKAGVLYLVAPKARPPEKEAVWEVSSMRPFKIEIKEELGEDLVFYKLVRGLGN